MIPDTGIFEWLRAENHDAVHLRDELLQVGNSDPFRVLKFLHFFEIACCDLKFEVSRWNSSKTPSQFLLCSSHNPNSKKFECSSPMRHDHLTIISTSRRSSPVQIPPVAAPCSSIALRGLCFCNQLFRFGLTEMSAIDGFRHIAFPNAPILETARQFDAHWVDGSQEGHVFQIEHFSEFLFGLTCLLKLRICEYELPDYSLISGSYQRIQFPISFHSPRADFPLLKLHGMAIGFVFAAESDARRSKVVQRTQAFIATLKNSPRRLVNFLFVLAGLLDEKIMFGFVPGLQRLIALELEFFEFRDRFRIFLICVQIAARQIELLLRSFKWNGEGLNQPNSEARCKAHWWLFRDLAAIVALE
jgi:hypothetical protein